jgi:hypothetical protein
MTDDIRELIDAARPFAETEPRVDWVCHGGDPAQWEHCGHCNRIRRLRAAIKAVEEAKTT